MDELDRRLAAILSEFDLPSDEWAIERVREDVEIAMDLASDTAPLELRKDDAIEVVNAAKSLLRLARQYKLACEEQLTPIRRLGRQANIRLALSDKGPIRRQWLGACAENFKGAWERLTSQASGIHYRDDPSPTLRFATACCKLVDDTVNESAVKRAYDEFRKIVEMTPEEYGDFCQSDLWRKLRRSDL